MNYRLRKFIRKIFASKEMRGYNAMCKRQVRELIKLSIETRPFDYSWFHEMVILQIRHMLEYYTAGNNVFQAEETLTPLKDSLKKILDLQKELDDGFDERLYPSKEAETYKQIYGIIGDNILTWWD